MCPLCSCSNINTIGNAVSEKNYLILRDFIGTGILVWWFWWIYCYIYRMLVCYFGKFYLPWQGGGTVSANLSETFYDMFDCSNWSPTNNIILMALMSVCRITSVEITLLFCTFRGIKVLQQFQQLQQLKLLLSICRGYHYHPKIMDLSLKSLTCLSCCELLTFTVIWLILLTGESHPDIKQEEGSPWWSS